MSEQISLRELREDAETASDQWVARLITPAQVLALVDAVEAAQRVIAKSSFHWEAQETIALTDALARFKDSA